MIASHECDSLRLEDSSFLILFSVSSQIHDETAEEKRKFCSILLGTERRLASWAVCQIRLWLPGMLKATSLIRVDLYHEVTNFFLLSSKETFTYSCVCLSFWMFMHIRVLSPRLELLILRNSSSPMHVVHTFVFWLFEHCTLNQCLILVHHAMKNIP